MSELECCPFCGREAYLDDEVVCCTGGEACVTGFLYKSPDAWNTRPIEDALRAEISALQSRLSDLENGRPMSEAPKDGTLILVETSDMFGKYFEIISWHAVSSQWVSIVGDCDDDLLRWWPLPGSGEK